MPNLVFTCLKSLSCLFVIPPSEMSFSRTTATSGIDAAIVWKSLFATKWWSTVVKRNLTEKLTNFNCILQFCFKMLATFTSLPRHLFQFLALQVLSTLCCVPLCVVVFYSSVCVDVSPILLYFYLCCPRCVFDCLLFIICIRVSATNLSFLSFTFFCYVLVTVYPFIG